MKTQFILVLSLGALALAAQPTQAAMQGLPCTPEWVPTFGGLASVDGPIHDAVTFDDGSGPALYVCGRFLRAGGVEAINIARFDGTNWSSVGGPGGMLDAQSHWTSFALQVFDDGTGPALYVGGRMTLPDGQGCKVARWDGASWQSVGQTFGTALDLVVYDDGSGPALYAGGEFYSFGNVGRLVNGQWQRLSGGAVRGGYIHDLEVHDDGSGAGPSLYVGGTFDEVRISGTWTPIQSLARWNAGGWSSVGSIGEYSLVSTMEAHDFGSGEELVIGGIIPEADGAQVHGLARWNGTTWAPVGLGPQAAFAPEVTALVSFDSPTGSKLVVGGVFQTVGGASGYSNLAVLEGSVWSNSGNVLGATFEDVTGLVPLPAGAMGQTPRLLVSGGFEGTGSEVRPWATLWTGSAWEPFGSPTMALSGEARAFEMFDSGAGEQLHVAGKFEGAGGEVRANIARWTGSAWESVGGGIPNAEINDLAVLDDGTGAPRLYAGGKVRNGLPTVWEFNGVAWTALPEIPRSNTSQNEGVLELEVFAGSGAPRLYAAGYFGTVNQGSHIVRWNGANWGTLGGGVRAEVNGNGDYPGVRALAVHDDGTGERLFVGGGFRGVPGLEAQGVFYSSYAVSYDGLQWHRCDGLNEDVTSFDVVSMGGVDRLVAAGEFQVGSTNAEYGLGQWDGTAWSPLPPLPSDLYSPQQVRANVGASGEQELVAVVADFSAYGQVLVRLDGPTWERLGAVTTGRVMELDSLDDGSGLGSLIYLGGDFTDAGDLGEAFVARFGGCSARDLGTVYCDAVPNSTGQRAGTSAFGSPFVGLNVVELTATDLPTSAFGYFIVSRTQGLVAVAGGSQGNLCLAGQVGRYSQQVLNSGAAGRFTLDVDLTLIPQPTGAVGVVAGETWNFQAWFRDANPTPTSNFSSGLSLQFE